MRTFNVSSEVDQDLKKMNYNSRFRNVSPPSKSHIFGTQLSSEVKNKTNKTHKNNTSVYMAFRKFFLEQRSITVFRFSKNLHDVEKV
jgi:hypothetical protein